MAASGAPRSAAIPARARDGP